MIRIAHLHRDNVGLYFILVMVIDIERLLFYIYRTLVLHIYNVIRYLTPILHPNLKAIVLWVFILISCLTLSIIFIW